MNNMKLRSSRAQLVASFMGLILLMMTGCQDSDPGPDAYGNFEAEDVIVSSEGTGKLLSFDVREGDFIRAGKVVGVVDTLQLVLQRRQLIASQEAVRARIPSVVAEIEVLEEEKRIALVELTRIENLLARNAATSKQKDDIDGRISVIDRQIRSIRSKHGPILAEVDVLRAQVAQIDDKIESSKIENPVAGTVLTTFVKASEIVWPGKPLYNIAPLDTLLLRAYVSGSQLANLKLGQSVTVLIDNDNQANTKFDGMVSWIASEAEFTPKQIQTRDERTNLVYAFKIRVPNPEGILKIGMPGEVTFGPERTTNTGQE